MLEEQTQRVVSNSIQNPSESQGVAAVNSAAQAPQDVTASVNTNSQQVQNPFVVNAPAIPTQEGLMGIRYAFGGKKVTNPKKYKQGNKPAKPTQIKQPKVIQEETAVPVIPGQTLAEPIVEQPQVQRPAMVAFDEEVPREIENGQVKPLERSMVSKEKI